MSKMGPALRIGYEFIRDRDFYNKRIRTGDFPVNFARGMAHALTGAIPLTAGSTIRTAIRGEDLGSVTAEGISQYLGTNYIPFDAIYDLKTRWRDELSEFNEIPTDKTELQKGARTRLQERQANPEIDAKKFMIGDVISLQSPSAFWEVLDIIRDNNINPDDIRGIQERKDKRKKYLKAGIPLEWDRIDALIREIETMMPEEQDSVAPTPVTTTPAYRPSTLTPEMLQKAQYSLSRTKGGSAIGTTRGQSLKERAREIVGVR
jgi:hypothetical protein